MMSACHKHCTKIVQQIERLSQGGEGTPAGGCVEDHNDNTLASGERESDPTLLLPRAYKWPGTRAPPSPRGVQDTNRPVTN
jgi:hypothetical protein